LVNILGRFIGDSGTRLDDLLYVLRSYLQILLRLVWGPILVYYGKLLLEGL